MVKVIIICLWGTCFNPQSITRLEQNSETCSIRFPIHKAELLGLNEIDVRGKCENVAAQINKEWLIQQNLGAK